MPITLPPVSRRQMLAGGLAATLAALLPRGLRAADAKPLDPHRLLLLSDVHVNGDKAYTHKTLVKPWDNLSQAVREVLARPTLPANALVNGDCACLHGLAADYATFVEGIEPLRQAGLPIHLVLGNHDARPAFFAGIAQSKGLAPTRVTTDPVADRQVSVVELERANLLLLDSLDVTNKTPGVLGEKQIAWLTKTLDQRATKPAIVFVHHDPDDPAAREKTKKALSGLTDTKALMDAILPRKHVKALVFGHTHVWKHTQVDGLHLVNLPTTAWVFGKDQPRGWVDLSLATDAATFELHSLDPAHPAHGQKFECAWR